METQIQISSDMCVLVPLHYIRPLIYRKGIEGWCEEENMDVLTHWRRHMSYIHSTFPACNRNLTIHRKLKCCLDFYNDVCSRICKNGHCSSYNIYHSFIYLFIWYDIFLCHQIKTTFLFFKFSSTIWWKFQCYPKLAFHG